jgi:hypothetical protein
MEKYESLEDRLHSFNLKMNHVPDYYEAAKITLKIPL